MKGYRRYDEVKGRVRSLNGLMERARRKDDFVVYHRARTDLTELALELARELLWKDLTHAIDQKHAGIDA